MTKKKSRSKSKPTTPMPVVQDGGLQGKGGSQQQSGGNGAVVVDTPAKSKAAPARPESRPVLAPARPIRPNPAPAKKIGPLSFLIAPPGGKGSFVASDDGKTSAVVITVDGSVLSVCAVSQNLIEDCNTLVGGGRLCPTDVAIDAMQYLDRALEALIKDACKRASQSVLISLLVWWKPTKKGALQAWSIAWEYWYA